MRCGLMFAARAGATVVVLRSECVRVWSAVVLVSEGVAPDP